MQSARALLFFAGISVLATASQAKPTNPVPSLLETAFGQCVVFDVNGGWPALAVDVTPAPVWVKKHISNFKWNDCIMSVSPGTTGGPLEFASGCFGAGQPHPPQFGFTLTTPIGDNAGVIRSFSGWTLSSFTIPACDVDATDPDYFRMSITGGTSPVTQTVSLKTKGGPGSVKQKPWLPSNFRLTITGADCSHVSSIDCITITQTVADLDGDGVNEYILIGDDLSFTMPIPDAATFISELANGGKGTPPRTAQLDLLDDQGNVLNSCVFRGVHTISTNPLSRNSGHAVEKLELSWETMDMK